jgi:hypothetical protein
MQGQNVNFPASGFGDQSAFWDEEILLNGSYSVISATIDSSSLDLTNVADTSILRKGLLLAPCSLVDNLYLPLSTENGYLNGVNPTQFMKEVVVLARAEHMNYQYILGNTRRRTESPTNRIVPVYLRCNIKEAYVLYNNSAVIAITGAQWADCQRISVVPSTVGKFSQTETDVRALLGKRIETKITSVDFG